MSKRFAYLAAAVVLTVAASTALATPVEVWLTAGDGIPIRGDLYAIEGDETKSAPMILLFHQAGSNRGEYAEIAPRLNELGFHALAIDQRSGGERWGFENETVKQLGESMDYLSALGDLEAALRWKTERGYKGKTLAWGSSYSAALVFLLAAKHSEIDGVLSFSPGEYLDKRRDEVSRAAKQLSQPVIVLTPDEERARAQPIVDVISSKDATFVIPEQAVHGSSMLVEARNPGAKAIWTDVRKFLAKFAS